MTLNTKTKQALKAKAHHLQPVVMIGSNGLTDAVHKEIDLALTHHELIKIKIAGNDKAGREEVLNIICNHHQAESVQLIGNIGVIYRKNKDKK